MSKVLGWSFVALVLIATSFVWCRVSDDCTKAKGVLIKDAAGFPACVPRAVAP